MNRITIMLMIMAFILGLTTPYLAAIVPVEMPSELSQSVSTPVEQSSPQDHVSEDKIKVYNDRIIINVENAEWARFTDTNSMDPVIDKGANALQFKPESVEDIEVGDIISYRSEYTTGIIIHRVVYKGQDDNGIYFIAKGDNNQTSDPGKIRFDNVERVLFGIIY